MILFIASEVMFFVAWFWMFFEMALFHHVRTFSPIDEVRTAWANWPPKGVETLDPWHFPLINTLTLLRRAPPSPGRTTPCSTATARAPGTA